MENFQGIGENSHWSLQWLVLAANTEFYISINASETPPLCIFYHYQDVAARMKITVFPIPVSFKGFACTVARTPVCLFPLVIFCEVTYEIWGYSIPAYDW